MNKNTFETKIKPVLSYVGAIGAGLMCIAYIIVVFVLIRGFQATVIFNTLLFAAVNAIVGFIIMQFLKVQGISFAKLIPENDEIIKEYYSTRTKDKKPHSMQFYWATSVAKDIFTKCLSVAITSAGLIYIVIQGSNDWNLLLLAIVNLIMFICFGFLTLVNAYEFFNNKFIPYMKEKIDETKIKEAVEVAEEERTNEGHDSMDDNIGTDILESVHSDGTLGSDSKPVVLDSLCSNMGILGRSTDTCDGSSDKPSINIKENI